MRQTINGADFRRLIISAAASIEINKQKINDLNVFPVPDGDTGTNMSMTLNTAAQDLKKADAPTLTKAADIAASAMLRGARGNSGVILSLLFRGFSKSLKGAETGDGVALANAINADPSAFPEDLVTTMSDFADLLGEYKTLLESNDTLDPASVQSIVDWLATVDDMLAGIKTEFGI